MNQNASVTPVHEPDALRWTVDVDGEQGLIEYTLADGVMTITHTEVPKALGGRGIAGELVRAALDHARAQGLRVRPTCSYAAAWISRHPEYQDLRAG
ncbi:MAG: GNAT family N-acetyltransferase [Luteimonas sp.]